MEQLTYIQKIKILKRHIQDPLGTLKNKQTLRQGNHIKMVVIKKVEYGNIKVVSIIHQMILKNLQMEKISCFHKRLMIIKSLENI